MSANTLNVIDNNLELLRVWFEDLDKNIYEYKEPILDEATIKLMKIACDSFRQDIHVFIVTIEILEEYIRTKNKMQQEIYDEVLVLGAAIFISSKYTGEQIDLKVKYIDSFLQKVTSREYGFKIIRAAEVDILRTLKGKLPITTVVDDLNTIVELYMKEFRLKGDIRNLCLQILTLIYTCRLEWFMDLKHLYNQNKESLIVFKFLVSNKFYLPVGVLITAFRLSNYKVILDIQMILRDITNYTKIHSDHLNILSDKIINVIHTRRDYYNR